MKRITLASLVFWTVGCAGAASSAGPDGARATLDTQALNQRIEALEQEDRRRRERIGELESQLALARAELAELRSVRSSGGAETVRIGAAARAPAIAAADDDWVDEDDRPTATPRFEAPEASPPSGPRPLLRLYGSPAVQLDGSVHPSNSPGAGGVPGRLSVAAIPAPLPEAELPPQAQAQASGRPARGGGRAELAVERYRVALEHVRAQRMEEALASLGAFIGEFPRHPYAANALYWRGEVRYALRQYPDALRDFQRLVREHPRVGKVPDALLKIGLCHQRMGDTARARAYFRRVRNEYPDSVAARLASQEDAS